jgi:hypothetical protein
MQVTMRSQRAFDATLESVEQNFAPSHVLSQRVIVRRRFQMTRPHGCVLTSVNTKNASANRPLLPANRLVPVNEYMVRLVLRFSGYRDFAQGGIH